MDEQKAQSASASAALRALSPNLASRIVELQYERIPQAWKPYDDPSRQASVRYARYHMDLLAEALESGDPGYYQEYMRWVKVFFASQQFSQGVMEGTMDCTRLALEELLPAEALPPVLEILQAGEHSLEQAPEELPTFLDGMRPIDDLARDFLARLLEGDRQTASRDILQAVRDGTPVRDIYLQVFQRTQREVGRLWQTNQISVAQEHFCSAATQMVMSQLYPYIFSGERKEHRMVMACVGGELHEIGARMVADFFEMEGWDTYFLGANMPPESILQTVEERQAHLLAISATMTYHVGRVRELIQMLREGVSNPPRVLVGGYPFNMAAGLWQSLGADGSAPDAQGALLAAERLMA